MATTPVIEPALGIPALVGPFAGLGIGYAVSKSGERTVPMVVGFVLGALAGAGISGLLIFGSVQSQALTQAAATPTTPTDNTLSGLPPQMNPQLG